MYDLRRSAELTSQLTIIARHQLTKLKDGYLLIEQFQQLLMKKVPAANADSDRGC